MIGAKLFRIRAHIPSARETMRVRQFVTGDRMVVQKDIGALERTDQINERSHHMPVAPIEVSISLIMRVSNTQLPTTRGDAAIAFLIKVIKPCRHRHWLNYTDPTARHRSSLPIKILLFHN